MVKSQPQLVIPAHVGAGAGAGGGVRRRESRWMPGGNHIQATDTEVDVHFSYDELVFAFYCFVGFALGGAFAMCFRVMCCSQQRLKDS
jgi:hypothetical protein